MASAASSGSFTTQNSPAARSSGCRSKYNTPHNDKRAKSSTSLERIPPCWPDVIPQRPSGAAARRPAQARRSEEHTSELQSRSDLVCRLLLEKKKQTTTDHVRI